MKYLNIASLTILGLFVAGTSWANSASVTVNVSCTILPVFELEVTGPAGGNIEFGQIQKEADRSVEATSSEVVIRANSNLGQPYIIKHELVTPLTNSNGSKLPEDAMSVNASAERGSAAQSRTVSTGPDVLYQSDASGKSDIVTARYDLNVRPDQDAGDYRSKLLYTIVTV